MLDKGFWKLPHTFYKKTAKLNNSEFRLLIFLNSCWYWFRYKPFFITDKQIAEFIGLSRTTIRRYRKHLKELNFIDYISGKYEEKATTYSIKSAPNLATECVKMAHRAHQNEPLLYNKNRNKEINKEYNLSPLEHTRKTYAKTKGW